MRWRRVHLTAMRLVGHTALFGGSFNPPHIGHQMVCLYALEVLGADEVWLLATPAHPFLKPLAPLAHRQAMCELLTTVFGGRVRVDDVESTAGLSGKTFDTLQHLRAKYPARRFALLLGSDLLAETPKWYRWDEIAASVPIAIVGRQGHADRGAYEVQIPDISSKEIRRRIQAGLNVEGLLPRAVVEYINKHGLYR
jgi:nicotinate-nucleotide adenylyltransferase